MNSTVQGVRWRVKAVLIYVTELCARSIFPFALFALFKGQVWHLGPPCWLEQLSI